MAARTCLSDLAGGDSADEPGVDCAGSPCRRLRLELASDVPPQLESAAPGARVLGFAVYGVEIE